MPKAIMEVLNVGREQSCAKVEVHFSVKEDCGNPISSFSRIFSIPINSATTNEEINRIALQKARELYDEEYPT
ncbi:MAG: hypothetical protein ABSC55_16980 [Syntrophorhabdales bacterium]|jgi:hypothetical protein